jgi:hypothetical protein
MSAKVSATQMVEDIDSSLRASNGIRLSAWEEDFYSTVKKNIQRKVPLTAGQAKKLEEIWDKV